MDNCPKKPSGLSTSSSWRRQAASQLFDCSYPDCNYKSERVSHVGRHEKIHYPNGLPDIPCHICFKIFLSIVTFLHHMSSQHGDQLVCPFCKFLAQDSTEFKAHMLAHSLTEKELRKQTEEVLSSRIAEILDNYKAQVSKSSDQVSKSSDGNKSVKKRPEFQQRGKNRVKKVVRVKGTTLLACEYCSFKTFYHRNLDKHLRVHTGERPFKCTNLGCDYRARWVQNIRRHQQKSCRGKKVQSAKSIETGGNLGSDTECRNRAQVNVESSSSSLAFACMLCDFIGDSESSALKHSRQHKTVVIMLDRI